MTFDNKDKYKSTLGGIVSLVVCCLCLTFLISSMYRFITGDTGQYSENYLIMNTPASELAAKVPFGFVIETRNVSSYQESWITGDMSLDGKETYFVGRATLVGELNLRGSSLTSPTSTYTSEEVLDIPVAKCSEVLSSNQTIIQETYDMRGRPMFEFRGAYCIDYRNFTNITLMRSPLGQKSYFIKFEIFTCHDYKKRSLLPTDHIKCASVETISDLTTRSRVLAIYQNQLIDVNAENPINRFTKTQSVSFVPTRRKVIQFDVESSVAKVRKGMFSYLSKDSNFNFVGTARPERLIPDVRMPVFNSTSDRPDGLVRLDIKLNIQSRIYKASRPLFEEFIYDLGSIIMIGCLIIWAVVIPLNKKMFAFALAKALNRKQHWLSEFEKEEMKILEDYSELKTLAQTQAARSAASSQIEGSTNGSSKSPVPSLKTKSKEPQVEVNSVNQTARPLIATDEEVHNTKITPSRVVQDQVEAPLLNLEIPLFQSGQTQKERRVSDELEQEINNSMSKPQINSSQGISVISSQKNKLSSRDNAGSQKNSKRSLQSLKNYNRSKFGEPNSEMNQPEAAASHKKTEPAQNMSMDNLRKEGDGTPSQKQLDKSSSPGPQFRPIMGFPLESDRTVQIIQEKDLMTQQMKKKRRNPSQPQIDTAENPFEDQQAKNYIDIERDLEQDANKDELVSEVKVFDSPTQSKRIVNSVPNTQYPLSRYADASHKPCDSHNVGDHGRVFKPSSMAFYQGVCRTPTMGIPACSGGALPSLGILDQNASIHHQPPQMSTKQSLEIGYSNYLKCHIKTKRQFKKATSYFEDLTLLDLVSDKFWPCLLKTKDRSKNAANAMADLGYTLDACRIVESLNTLDKLLRVLFTADQLMLFESIPNYERRHFNHVETELTIEQLLGSNPDKSKKLKQAATRTFLKTQKTELDEQLLNHCYHLVDDTMVADSAQSRNPKPRANSHEKKSPHLSRR